jgi:hypothetical protein
VEALFGFSQARSEAPAETETANQAPRHQRITGILKIDPDKAEDLPRWVKIKRKPKKKPSNEKPRPGSR